MLSGVGVQVPPSAPTLNQKVECKQFFDAGWSSLVARRAHNPKVVGSNPAPATKFLKEAHRQGGPFCTVDYCFLCYIGAINALFYWLSYRYRVVSTSIGQIVMLHYSKSVSVKTTD